MRFFLCLFLFNLLLVTACDQSSKTAEQLLEKGHYEAAFGKFEKRAEAGDADAQNYLASMYYVGLHKKRDIKLAYDWFLKAAEQGSASAQYNLGNMYDNDETEARNYVKAYMWFYVAEQQGHKKARHRMALLLENHKVFTNQVDLATDLAKPYLKKFKAKK